MSKVELHMHSAASDGRLSPEDVVRESGEQLIALAEQREIKSASP